MDLSTTLNVIYFFIITASVAIFVHILAGIYGFINGPRVDNEYALHNK
jgi:hypothetical protein